MRTRPRTLLFPLVFALAVACGGPTNADTGTSDATDDAVDATPGDTGSDGAPVDTGAMTCTGIGTCPSGFECIAGFSGCSMPTVCVPSSTTMCSRTSEPFCGCNGMTFMARGGCPDQPFAYRGECMSDGGTGG